MAAGHGFSHTHPTALVTTVQRSTMISSGRLNDLRKAAEQAWGDDTRHEKFIGHPQPSAGQCYVTAQWLTNKLGGHIGVKNGHHFWVSPDHKFALDLTGELFAYPPAHSSANPEDVEPHHKMWRPGPVVYKRTDHPLFKGYQVIDSHPDHPRAKQFARKADLALQGARISAVHVADLLGPSPYEYPQDKENYDNWEAPFPVMLHDEPWDPSQESSDDYNWIYANGQLHVSPHHEHNELLEHSGTKPSHQGPMAMGVVHVNQNHALWEVESNLSLRGLEKLLKDYTETAGWQWEGMVGMGGEFLHDDFGPKMSMWYIKRDGHVYLSKTPLPNGLRCQIEGKTAYVTNPLDDGLQEWAKDSGYKLAEYPGGGNMLDYVKIMPNLDIKNVGDQDWMPQRQNPDAPLGDSLKCGTCGEVFPSLEELRVHERYEHRPKDYQEIPHTDFPNVQPFDEPLGFGTRPTPDTGLVSEGSVKTVVMVLPSYTHAKRHPRFATYASVFGYDTDDNHQFYGAFRGGQLVGYGAVRLEWGKEPEVLMIDAIQPRQGIGSAIMGLIQNHFDHFYTHADSKAGEGLMWRMGMVNVNGYRWRYSKGEQPKDMIEAPIPFVFEPTSGEHRNGWIHIGYPGQSTHDIEGSFHPSQMVEGYYEPGGKIIILHGGNNVLYTARHLAEMWYHRFPQMEITSIEREDGDGKPQKIASINVGNYIRSILPSDQAAFKAYEALRDAGGKVYAVGGAIRDALLQKEPKDIDLMVAGLPAEEVDHVLAQLPGRVDLTGKRFGVYRYRINGQEVEVALPRQDTYEESGRGKGVINVDHRLPVSSDLQRRDFTVNSMAVDLDTGQLIDPFGGVNDLENHILRTTHPDSFKEDPTRTIRALTMHGRYGLLPDERTRGEMESHGHLLRHESPDALNKVIDKMLGSGNPSGAVRLAQETGTLQHFFPEVAQNWDFDQNNRHHSYPLGTHLMHVLDNVSQISDDPDLRLAALYHDVGKPASAWLDPETGQTHYYTGPNGEGANHEDVGAKMTEDRMRALNYPVARINKVRHLIQHHMFPAFNSPRGARRFLNRVGDVHADDLLKLRQADMGGKGQSAEELAAKTSVDRMRQLVNEARSQNAPTALSGLAINGNDLLAMGLKPGPQVGTVLNQLLRHVINNPQDNDRQILLQRAQQLIGS